MKLRRERVLGSQTNAYEGDANGDEIEDVTENRHEIGGKIAWIHVEIKNHAKGAKYNTEESQSKRQYETQTGHDIGTFHESDLSCNYFRDIRRLDTNSI
jgi:hypothetical protein